MACDGSQRGAATAAARREMAPTGSLRVGLLAGAVRSPLLVTVDEDSGHASGVAATLGEAIGARLGLPVEQVVHGRIADIDRGAEQAAFDLTFLPVTPAREACLAFGPTYFTFDNGLLATDACGWREIDDSDRPGIRIGVQADSLHQRLLEGRLRHARLVAVDGLHRLAALLAAGDLDAVAHAVPVLRGIGRRLPGTRLLDVPLSTSTLAIAVPAGRPLALSQATRFMDSAQRSGLVARAFAAAGLHADGSASAASSE